MDEIIINEQSSDKTVTYAYYNHMSYTWIAYGYSAYALRVVANKHMKDSFRGYSFEYDMPYTVVDDKVIRSLFTEFDDKFMIFENQIVLKGINDFNVREYDKWVAKLKNEQGSLGGKKVVTPVSHLVPKDQYIMDGMSSFSRNSKRLFDLFVSFVLMIVLSPLLLVIAIAIKIDDKGPVIFKQERIGRFGRPFYIYKFRSMRTDAEAFGPELSHGGGSGDKRLTKVGAFIRRHHLDELPQLWNVFIGDMAFVGPRPERKYYIDQILEHDKRYTYLYQIRPGVTSYATFYNGYTDTMEKMLRRLEYDLYYLINRSWKFDMKIMAMTALAVFFGKKF